MPAPDPLTEALEAELQIIAQNQEKQRGPNDDDLQFYARIRGQIAADRIALDASHAYEIERLKGNYALCVKQLDQREAGIDWKFGLMAQQAVKDATHGKRQRFVQTIHGRVGFRKQAAKQVRHINEEIDSSTLLAWAEENCKKAVVEHISETVNLKALPETCEHIWIEDKPAADVFYFKAPKTEEEKAAEKLAMVQKVLANDTSGGTDEKVKVAISIIEETPDV